jgi:multiple sugar transport system ATP-binding protein
MLYHKPVNLFVASFIGSPAMNMLEGRLVETETGLAFMIGGYRIDLPPALLERVPGLSHHVGRALVIGIRPEAVHCVMQGHDQDRSLVGTIAFTEDLGATILVHLDIDAPPPRLDAGRIGITKEQSEISLDARTARVRTSVDGLSTFRPGDHVPIRFDLDRLHLFDPSTGVALTG